MSTTWGAVCTLITPSAPSAPSGGAVYQLISTSGATAVQATLLVQDVSSDPSARQLKGVACSWSANFVCRSVVLRTAGLINKQLCANLLRAVLWKRIVGFITSLGRVRAVSRSAGTSMRKGRGKPSQNDQPDDYQCQSTGPVQDTRVTETHRFIVHP
jgi:hypothetical protein